MKWNSLRHFVEFLKDKNEIVFIREEMDPVLEIAEIADRVMKREGPALYFEKVKGSQFPLLINLYGIESPGLTSSLAIADHVAAMLGAR